MTAIDALLSAERARNPTEVRTFLIDNDDLLPHIETARQLVQQVFKEDASGLVLWISGDTDHEDTYLTVGIATNLPPREAVERMHKVDAEWLSTADEFVRDHLLVTLVMS